MYWHGVPPRVRSTVFAKHAEADGWVDGSRRLVSVLSEPPLAASQHFILYCLPQCLRAGRSVSTLQRHALAAEASFPACSRTLTNSRWHEMCSLPNTIWAFVMRSCSSGGER